MPKTIGLVQVKGGAGRSTLSTTIAGELSKKGKTVLIDGDMPQGTSASWFAMRAEAGKTGQLRADTAANHHELLAKVGQYQDADFIVLDGPPRIAEMTRAILVLSDLCLVPVGASKPEIWATTDILPIVEEAKKVRQVEARMIWTRYRGNTKLAKALTQQAEEELGFPIMETALAYRVAYQEAIGEGLTAAELPNPEARAEVAALLDEIAKILD